MLCTSYFLLPFKWHSLAKPDVHAPLISENLQQVIRVVSEKYVEGSVYVGVRSHDKMTANDNAIYYHVTENSIGSIWLEGIKRDEVKGIRLLADGSEVKIVSNWIVDNYPEAVFVDVSETVALPDTVDTVLKVILI